jgi:hypothetical protein
VSYSTLAQNQAIGGAGDVGGNGGDGLGGGLVVQDSGSATLSHSRVTGNEATGGAAGAGGTAGLGQGGGIYLLGGQVCVEYTWIADNHASDSDDDVFGDLCFI